MGNTNEGRSGLYVSLPRVSQSTCAQGDKMRLFRRLLTTDLVTPLSTLPECRAKRQNDRQRVEQRVNDILNQHRHEHEATHRRSLAVCRIDRCNVFGAGISVAYVGALGACGVGVMTEEVVLSGTLSSLAIAHLSACVTTAGDAYASGWTFCASMT